MPAGDSSGEDPRKGAAAGDPGGTAGQADSDQRACMPCRGTGKVLAAKDGEQVPVTCPWCQGTGLRVTGIDTQASGPASEAASR
jgi:DnaJ-class molecular chaperone